MDEKKHKAFTGFEAKIDNREGGYFVTCGKRNFGYSLHLKRGKRIIQAWSHIHFKNKQFSIIDISLIKLSNNKTKIVFYQNGTPVDAVAWLKPGWESTYWKPLKDFLEKGIIQEPRK